MSSPSNRASGKHRSSFRTSNKHYSSNSISGISKSPNRDINPSRVLVSDLSNIIKITKKPYSLSFATHKNKQYLFHDYSSENATHGINVRILDLAKISKTNSAFMDVVHSVVGPSGDTIGFLTDYSSSDNRTSRNLNRQAPNVQTLHDYMRSKNFSHSCIREKIAFCQRLVSSCEFLLAKRLRPFLTSKTIFINDRKPVVGVISFPGIFDTTQDNLEQTIVRSCSLVCIHVLTGSIPQPTSNSYDFPNSLSTSLKRLLIKSTGSTVHRPPLTELSDGLTDELLQLPLESVSSVSRRLSTTVTLDIDPSCKTPPIFDVLSLDDLDRPPEGGGSPKKDKSSARWVLFFVIILFISNTTVNYPNSIVGFLIVLSIILLYFILFIVFKKKFFIGVALFTFHISMLVQHCEIDGLTTQRLFIFILLLILAFLFNNTILFVKSKNFHHALSAVQQLTLIVESIVMLVLNENLTKDIQLFATVLIGLNSSSELEFFGHIYQKALIMSLPFAINLSTHMKVTFTVLLVLSLGYSLFVLKDMYTNARRGVQPRFLLVLKQYRAAFKSNVRSNLFIEIIRTYAIVKQVLLVQEGTYFNPYFSLFATFMIFFFFVTTTTVFQCLNLIAFLVTALCIRYAIYLSVATYIGGFVILTFFCILIITVRLPYTKPAFVLITLLNILMYGCIILTFFSQGVYSIRKFIFYVFMVGTLVLATLQMSIHTIIFLTMFFIHLFIINSVNLPDHYLWIFISAFSIILATVIPLVVNRKTLSKLNLAKSRTYFFSFGFTLCLFIICNVLLFLSNEHTFDTVVLIAMPIIFVLMWIFGGRIYAADKTLLENAVSILVSIAFVCSYLLNINKAAHEFTFKLLIVISSCLCWIAFTFSVIKKVFSNENSNNRLKIWAIMMSIIVLLLQTSFVFFLLSVDIKITKDFFDRTPVKRSFALFYPLILFYLVSLKSDIGTDSFYLSFCICNFFFSFMLF
ncbi:hypothetical protein PCE1_001113 [Barthelona sp. PCE]